MNLNLNTLSYLLITLSGPDRPGITAMLTSYLAMSHHKMLDIGQSVIGGMLTLSVLLEVLPDEENKVASHDFLKNILFESKKLGLHLEFELLNENEIAQIRNSTSSLAQKNQYVLTCVASQTIQTQFLAALTHQLAASEFNIQKIDNGSFSKNLQVVEIVVSGNRDNDFHQIKKNLLLLAGEYHIDMAVTENDVFRYNKRLVVFDMDSTLIRQEVIDELAREHGVAEQVIRITEDAMRGKIDFSQSLKMRVALLKGLSRDKIENVKKRLELTEGTLHCIKTLKSLGFKTAIISGGFNEFTTYIAEKLSMNYHFSNHLQWEDHKLTGTLENDIIDAAKKASLLKVLAQAEGIDLKQTVAIGDGSNDLLMLSTAGMGIAFHAKEIVRDKSSHQLSFGPMTSILPMLGIPLHYGAK